MYTLHRFIVVYVHFAADMNRSLRKRLFVALSYDMFRGKAELWKNFGERLVFYQDTAMNVTVDRG